MENYKPEVPNLSKEETISMVLAENEAFDQAMLVSDTLKLEEIFADDFMFTHGDGWIHKDNFLSYEDKKVTMEAVKKKPFQYRNTIFSDAELHDDVAVVNGKYNSGMNIGGQDLDIVITYLRVYAFRQGQWKLLSHKTVNLESQPQ